MTWAERPSNWDKPGHIARGDENEAILDQIDSLTDPGWTSYTPTWTADSVNPALGNGTITGRYRQANGGDLVIGTVRILMGTTTTYGTGAWRLTQPVTMSANSILDGVAWGLAYDSSSTALYVIGARAEGGSNLWRMGSGGGSVVLSTVPFTWATSDVLLLNFAYEPA